MRKPLMRNETPMRARQAGSIAFTSLIALLRLGVAAGNRLDAEEPKLEMPQRHLPRATRR